LKQTFLAGLRRDQLKKRPMSSKVLDAFIKWRRGALLSSPVTLAKLTSAAIERMAFTPTEQAVGSIYQRILPRVASKAIREVGFNARAEAKALTEGFTQGLKDSWQTIRTGKSDLDAIFGKYGDSEMLGTRPGKDPNAKLGSKVAHGVGAALEFMGTLHSALKAPAKRNEFTRSFEMRVAKGLKDGVDVTDPTFQMSAGIEAYKDANRAIFMQDNRVVKGYKSLLASLERPDAKGKTSPAGKVAATVMKTLLPIVKVPTNVAGETFQHVGGVPYAVLYELPKAYAKGLENLQPEEADIILRHLKKGSLGAAGMALGYFMPNAFGGYYQPGEKRDDKDVKVGGVRIMGVDIPRYLVHNPLLETMQIGATVRRVADSKFRKSDEEPQGITHGLIAGALGLTEEVPFVKEATEMDKLFSPQERKDYIGELAKSIAVPQLSQWIAQQTDKEQGETVKRKPESIWEHIETGIPGLRGNVPRKEPLLSPEEQKLIDEKQLRYSKPDKLIDLIKKKREAGADTADLEDTLRQRIENKAEAGKLTQAEADQVNEVLNLKDKDAFQADGSNIEPPKLPKYNKNADGILETISTYADAIGTDPITAAKRILAGERIVRLENGTIIVKRMTEEESQALAKRKGGTKEMRLDHREPLELGGDNSENNLRLVTKEEWESYTPIENALAAALHDKKITGSEARQLVVDFKDKKITAEDVRKRIQ